MIFNIKYLEEILYKNKWLFYNQIEEMKRPKNPRSLKPIENKLRIDQYEPLVKKVIAEAPHMNHQTK